MNDTNNSDKRHGMRMINKVTTEPGIDNHKHGHHDADPERRARGKRQMIEHAVRKLAEAAERDPQVHRLAYKCAESPLRERHPRRPGEDIIDYAVRLQGKAYRHYTRTDHLLQEAIKSRAVRALAADIGFDIRNVDLSKLIVDWKQVLDDMRDWANNNHAEEMAEIDHRYNRIADRIYHTAQELTVDIPSANDPSHRPLQHGDCK